VHADSGVNVIVGETKMLNKVPNKSWQRAVADKFKVMPISEAAEKAGHSAYASARRMAWSSYTNEIRNT